MQANVLFRLGGQGRRERAALSRRHGLVEPGLRASNCPLHLFHGPLFRKLSLIFFMCNIHLFLKFVPITQLFLGTSFITFVLSTQYITVMCGYPVSLARL